MCCHWHTAQFLLKMSLEVTFLWPLWLICGALEVTFLFTTLHYIAVAVTDFKMFGEITAQSHCQNLCSWELNWKKTAGNWGDTCPSSPQLAKSLLSSFMCSLFTGTTRESSNGRQVMELSCEAYRPMAEQELVKICKQIRERWNIVNICVVHRLGYD